MYGAIEKREVTTHRRNKERCRKEKKKVYCEKLDNRKESMMSGRG